MRRILGCAVALFCVMPLTRLAGQGTASLAGTFRDQAGIPVRGVRISSESGSAAAVSDSEGRFMLRDLPATHMRFLVQRIGYEAGDFSLDLAPHASLDYDFTLVKLAVTLPGMESRANATSAVWLKAFNDHRVSQGGGHFFTRDDIERINPRQLSDVLRTVPGLRMTGDNTGQHTAEMGRSNLGAWGSCPIQYWIDGMRVQSLNVDDISPKEVEAVEVYAGPATLPPEYRTRTGTSGCGTIVIWTRAP